MHTLTATSLQLQYGTRLIAKDMSVSFMKPEIVSIIGPNGSGKSTLLKALGRLLEPTAGAVHLDGQDMKDLSSETIARLLSVLPQSAQAPGDMTIRDLVSCGRMPYQTLFSSLKTEDQKAIDEALEATGLLKMQHRPLTALSGGERQRAWLAMALAQEPHILLLDEPTTYLDIRHQLELMQLVKRLHTTRGITVIMVLHDLNHAAQYSHRLIAVKGGEIVADGTVKEVFTKENIETIYDVKARVTEMEIDGQPYPVCFPYERVRK